MTTRHHFIPRTSYTSVSSGDTYSAADGTLLAELLLVADGTDDVLSARYKALRSDQLFADLAAEALGVPLSSLVFVLLHTCEKTLANYPIFAHGDYYLLRTTA